MSTMASLIVKIGADTGGLTAGLNSAQSKVRAFGQTMKNIGTGLTLGITAPIIGVATQAIRSAASFERSMNVMRVVTGATESQMAALQEEALRLGQVTSFSAGEAAEAMLELGKAGMSTEEILASIGGVLDLAAAGNLELDRAAEITANTLNVFNLSASEATTIANLLAAAANASSVEVVDLADSLNMAGAVMAQYGVTVQDTVTALALLGNAGIKGSDAGTSLKTMMMRLAAPTDTALATMQQYNIAVYDSQGAMLPLLDILRQLDRAFAGVSEAQRNAAMTQIFGADAVRAANILIGASGEEWDEMSRAVNDGNAATKAAQANMAGLAGAFEYLSGTVDSFLIGQALPFSDALGGMIRSAADLLTSLGNLPEPTQRFAAVMVALLAVAGPTLVVLGGMATGLSLLMAPAGLAAIAMVALAAVMVANWGTISSATTQAIDAMAPQWERFQGWIAAAQAGDWTTVVQGIKAVGAEVQGLGTSAATLGSLKSAQLRTKIGAQVSVAMDAIELDLSPVTERIRTQLNLMRAGLVMAASTLELSAVTQQVTGSLNKIKLGVLLALTTGGDWFSADAVAGWWARQTAGLRTQFDQVLAGDNVLSRSLATAQGALNTIQATTQGAGQQNAAGQFAAAVTVATTALNAMSAIKTDAIEAAATAVTGLATALINLGTAGVDKVDPQKLASMALSAANPWGPLIDALTNTDNLAGLGAAYGQFVTTVAAKLGSALASDDFGTQFGFNVGRSVAQLARGAAALVKGFMDQITLTDITTYQGQVDTFVQGFVAGVVEGIKSVDWSIVGAALKDLILFQLQQFLGDKNALGLIPGPIGMAGNQVGKMVGLPTLADQIDIANQLGPTFLDLTRDADILHTELSKFGPAVDAATTGLASLPTADVLSMLAGAGLNGPTLDVAAKVVSVEPAAGSLPVVDVAANVLQVQQPTAQFPTMMGLLGGAEETAGSTLADAASQLTNWSFDWPALPEWTWPTLPTFTWPTLPRWSWPSIPTPGWLSRLYVPRPEWLGELLTWSPVVRLQTGGPGPSPALGTNALGTASWRGGWSMVGERGPELAYVPAGTRIYNANETRDLMAAGNGGEVHVHLDGAVIRNELDIEALAYRVAQKMRQRRA